MTTDLNIDTASKEELEVWLAAQIGLKYVPNLSMDKVLGHMQPKAKYTKIEFVGGIPKIFCNWDTPINSRLIRFTGWGENHYLAVLRACCNGLMALNATS